MPSEFCRDHACSRRNECQRYRTDKKDFDPNKREWRGCECSFFMPVGIEMMSISEYAEQKADEAREMRKEMF